MRGTSKYCALLAVAIALTCPWEVTSSPSPTGEGVGPTEEQPSREDQAKTLLSSFLETHASGLYDLKAMTKDGTSGRDILGARKNGDHSRALQTQPTYGCGEVIASWSKAEFEDVVLALLSESNVEFLNTPTGQGILLNQIKSGVQVRKVCASCSDFREGEGGDTTRGFTSASAFASFCGSDMYGSDANVSGLVVIPGDVDGDSGEWEPVAGVLKGSVFAHGTLAETYAVPSDTFNPESLTGSYDSVATLLAALTPNTVIFLPDYLGYGESGSGDYYKNYLVRDAYKTATIPLYLQVQEQLKEETGCNTELGNTVVVSGYSEGGYAAVAIGEGFSDLGFNVVGVHAGGGPYFLSGATPVKGTELFLKDEFPDYARYYLALWGTPYSSGNPNLANYNMGQDLLSDEYRAELMEKTKNGAPASEINADLPNDDGRYGSLSVVNPDMLRVLTKAVKAKDLKPCVTMVDNTTDYLCEALQDNDLLEVIATSSYSTRLCHGTQDMEVPVENVPSEGGGKNVIISLKEGEGHGQAAMSCLVDTFTYFLFNFGAVPAASSGICDPPAKVEGVVESTTSTTEVVDIATDPSTEDTTSSPPPTSTESPSRETDSAQGVLGSSASSATWPCMVSAFLTLLLVPSLITYY